MRARLTSIAGDVAAVVEADEPLLTDYHATVALLLAIASFESGYHRLVDSGRWRGDAGASWCLLQVRVGSGAVYWGPAEMRAWRGVDLVADRRKCLRAGLALLRESVKACTHLTGASRFSAYTAGKCIRGERAAANRWRLALEILKRGGR